MLELEGKTSNGKFKKHCAENFDEMSVEQYQSLINPENWDKEDWIKAFSILSELPVDYIATSKDGNLESKLYQCIEFLYRPYEQWGFNLIFEVPKEGPATPTTITMRPIWTHDAEFPTEVPLPKNLGRLPIGQSIQARRLLEELPDYRMGMSMITAIYLQPLIDVGKKDVKGNPIGFDMLRVTEIEYMINKMSITKIYPIAFFLLRKLDDSGSWLTRSLNLVKRMLTRKGKS